VEVIASIPLLNTKQYLIFSILNYIVDTDKGSLFFINGPGGTKKTFL
jgi:hypothetical protein